MLEIKNVNKGAELVSIKVDGIEKIHNGIKDWNRHSPILFPIVGKLKNGKTLIYGNEYEMGQHGFARDMEFEKIGENKYLLKSNEETIKKFPFKFELYVSYKINENELEVNYKVINKDEKQIYFGIGAHPAFVCDYSSGKYFVEFEKDETSTSIYKLANGLLKEDAENTKELINSNILHLNKDTFNEDALVIKNIKSKFITLKSKDNDIVKIDMEDFKHIGIWSKPGANFVCLEPWMNTADRINSDGEFKNKEDIIKLNLGEEWKASYKIIFNI